MNKRPDKTEQTKADLQEAFWKLYAAAAKAPASPALNADTSAAPQHRNPIEAITVQQVADAAGYNRGTLYHHYHDLYELLESIESHLLEGMTACVSSCMERLEADSSKAAKLLALKDVILFYERNRRYICVLLGSGGDPTFVPRLKEALKPLWLRYVLDPTQVAQRTPGEVDLLLEYTLSGTLYMVGRWLEEPAGVSAAQMGHLVYDLAIRDVATR